MRAEYAPLQNRSWSLFYGTGAVRIGLHRRRIHTLTGGSGCAIAQGPFITAKNFKLTRYDAQELLY